MELGQFLPECSLDVDPPAITDAMSLTTSRQMLGTKEMDGSVICTPSPYFGALYFHCHNFRFYRIIISGRK